MKQKILIALLAGLLVGCEYRSTTTTTNSADEKLMDASFKAGVRAAIRAHLYYLKSEIKNGNGEKVGVWMPPEQWESRSFEIWNKENTNFTFNPNL